MYCIRCICDFNNRHIISQLSLMTPSLQRRNDSYSVVSPAWLSSSSKINICLFLFTTAPTRTQPAQKEVFFFL